MPRIYRISLKLYNCIDARPLRQPFFDHASDDDLVAACMGYDNVADLNRLRLLFPIIMWPYSRQFQPLRICHEDQAKVLALLHEIEWFSGYRNKTVDFCFRIRELVAEGTFSAMSLRYAAKILQTLGDLTEPVALGRARYVADTFNFDPRIRGSLLFPLQSQPAAIEPPADLKADHNESIESCLRIALLLESVKVMKKPSEWGRLFPGCVAKHSSESSNGSST